MSNMLMKGKRGLIMGLANDKSIAWGIAKECAEAGADLAFSYQGEALKKRVLPLANSVGSDFLLECDVSISDSLDSTFAEIKKQWGNLDFVVHAIGFSDKSELRGRYVETSKENFINTMDISVYSFTAVTKRASDLMPNGGSILTLTYYGAEQVMPHYNVMGVAKAALEASVMYLAEDLGKDGIRVNAVCPGFVKTGMQDREVKWEADLLGSTPSDVFQSYIDQTPLGRIETAEDVADVVVFLASDKARFMTGQGINVTGGVYMG